MTAQLLSRSTGPSVERRPRLGFLGVGWIGLNRLEAVVQSGRAEVAAVADLSTQALRAAEASAPRARCVATLQELLEQNVDGIVIATPNAWHVPQALAALDAGCAVFIQKPMARTAAETAQILQKARACNRPLAVDLCYRHVRGVAELRRRLHAGSIGDVFAAELTFHNAYGPDKAWFLEPDQSGGGCVLDLGTHLIDLLLWVLDFKWPSHVESRLYSKGRRLHPHEETVEDAGFIQLDFASGLSARIGCSWWLSAGRDAIIAADFYGAEGALSLRNVDGSFYDFRVEHWRGRQRETLADPPDAWGGRALLAWCDALAQGRGYAAEADHLLAVAAILDRVYGR